MWNRSQSRIMAVGVCLLAACLGCQNGQPTDDPNESSGRTDAEGDD